MHLADASIQSGFAWASWATRITIDLTTLNIRMIMQFFLFFKMYNRYRISRKHTIII